MPAETTLKRGQSSTLTEGTELGDDTEQMRHALLALALLAAGGCAHSPPRPLPQQPATLASAAGTYPVAPAASPAAAASLAVLPAEVPRPLGDAEVAPPATPDALPAPVAAEAAQALSAADSPTPSAALGPTPSRA